MRPASRPSEVSSRDRAARNEANSAECARILNGAMTRFAVALPEWFDKAWLLLRNAGVVN
jgi:hypothetical protein